jgi:hypothetical protein
MVPIVGIVPNFLIVFPGLPNEMIPDFKWASPGFAHPNLRRNLGVAMKKYLFPPAERNPRLMLKFVVMTMVLCSALIMSNWAAAQPNSIHSGNYRSVQQWTPSEPRTQQSTELPVFLTAGPTAESRLIESAPIAASPATRRIDPGDTRGSQSTEARSMSPPHWGEEPEYLPPMRQANRSPRAGEWLPQDDTLPGMASPHVASPNVTSPNVTSQADVAEANPFSQASVRREAPGPRPRSMYRSAFDGEFLESLNNENWSPNFVSPYQDYPYQAPQQSTPFRQPQSIHERGYRQPQPFSRGSPFDTGAQFDFENKHQEFPPMREIIATGRFFGMTEVWLLRPHFGGNQGLATQTGGFLRTFPADHAYETAPRFRVGFESSYGPGVELSYLQFHHRSTPLSFTSTGTTSGTSFLNVIGSPNPLSLSTTAAGQRLEVGQSLEVHTFQANAFKEVAFARARINGVLGMKSAAITHDFRGRVFDGAGTVVDFLEGSTVFRGYGPVFSIEYYRPVGHTKLELFGAAAGSTMMGNRRQWVNAGDVMGSLRTNSLELLTFAEISTGLQYKYHYAEKRCVYGRLAMTHQSWLGGGTPTNPDGDFGFRGVGFAVGVNR